MRNWIGSMRLKAGPIEKVEKRVMEIFGVEKDVIYSKSRRRIQVAARSLPCRWAARELGFAASELAKRFNT